MGQAAAVLDLPYRNPSQWSISNASRLGIDIDDNDVGASGGGDLLGDRLGIRSTVYGLGSRTDLHRADPLAGSAADFQRQDEMQIQEWFPELAVPDDHGESISGP
jgi:hypothetical protein